MDELLTDLEIVDVLFDENYKKVTIVCLDDNKGEVREVTFNKQVYDQQTKKFVDNDEKAEKVREWCEEHFNLSFEDLPQAIGRTKDVYCYSNFNSFFPVKMITKFDDDMVGQIFETIITEAEDDGQKISLRFEYEGNLYESKMQYADYLEARQEWFINPIRKKKQYEKFEEKFNISVENIDEMVGKTVMVEVKKAYGRFVYSEIKPFKKVKK